MSGPDGVEQDFAGKAVIVTGAAGGLGRVTAEAFLARGASVLLVDVNAERLAVTVAEIGGTDGRARSFTADIGKRDQCFGVIAEAVAAFGKLDVLANVAGVLGIHRFTDITQAEVERIFAINLAGPLYLAQAAIPHLLESSGNIVNVASSAGLQGSAYLAPYTASKAALIHMTRSMAMEYMKAPIRINAVSPGPMATDIASGHIWHEDMDRDLVKRFAGFRAKDRAAESVAEAIVFVASDRAHAIHGANIPADNGATAG